MKKLVLLVALLTAIGCTAVFADIFQPVGPKNDNLKATNVSAIFDSGTALTDAAQIINYLGVKEGYAYNFQSKEWVNTVGATVVTYAPWGVSLDVEMLKADGVAGVVAWNVGSILPVANVPVMKYFQYLYIDGGCGMEQNSASAWKVAPVVGAEFKFSF
jgi:opacity protein-like surface antigen